MKFQEKRSKVSKKSHFNKNKQFQKYDRLIKLASSTHNDSERYSTFEMSTMKEPDSNLHFFRSEQIVLFTGQDNIIVISSDHDNIVIFTSKIIAHFERWGDLHTLSSS